MRQRASGETCEFCNYRSWPDCANLS